MWIMSSASTRSAPSHPQSLGGIKKMNQKEMKKKKNIEFSKMKSAFKKDAKIKECFHFDNDSCSNKIIAAHSIQRSGVLSLIEDEVDGNKSVYSFLHLKHNEEGAVIGFEPLGKKNASTFSGFCGHHDTNLFQEIENNPIDIENDEHCFLLSYRAFAMDFHSKQETLKGFKKNELYNKPEMKTTQEHLISGSELAMRDNKVVKDRLNEMLKNENYSELEYFSYSLDYTVPLALAASFNPDYSYSNQLLNKSEDPKVVYEFVNFTIIPMDSGETHILFSCLPEQEKSVKFIDELSELPELKLEKAISSIIIAYIENTFISPKIWEKLGGKKQNQLIKELYATVPPMRSMLNKFFHSEINLLSKRYKKNAT
jgi:hypothetical protein